MWVQYFKDQSNCYLEIGIYNIPSSKIKKYFKLFSYYLDIGQNILANRFSMKKSKILASLKLKII